MKQANVPFMNATKPSGGSRLGGTVVHGFGVLTLPPVPAHP